jgi:hypothetical protein
VRGDVSDRLAGGVDDLIAAGDLLDGPGRRKRRGICYRVNRIFASILNHV